MAKITRRSFLKLAGTGLVLGAKGCKAPEKRAPRQAQAKPAQGTVHWKERLKQIPKPVSDPVKGLVSKRILMGELVWATQARLLEQGRLGNQAERRNVMPNEPVRTMQISDALMDFLQEKKFLPKRKFDCTKLADYYEVRSAWYKHCYSMLKGEQFFRYENPEDKTRMLVAAGKGPDGLREVFARQKILDSGELGRYARSIIEYAKWAR